MYHNSTQQLLCASRFTYLEHEIHAVFGLVEQSSANLPVLELHRYDASFGIVQKDDGHADAGIARDGHCDDKSTCSRRHQTITSTQTDKADRHDSQTDKADTQTDRQDSRTDTIQTRKVGKTEDRQKIHDEPEVLHGWANKCIKSKGILPVSYTHLTLPTIYSV